MNIFKVQQIPVFPYLRTMNSLIDKHKFGSTGSCKMKRRPAEESEKCLELLQIRTAISGNRKEEKTRLWIDEFMKANDDDNQKKVNV